MSASKRTPAASHKGGGEKRGKPTPALERGQPRKTALVTGITGQDGSYLAELLLEKGYEVVGVVRRTSHDSYERIGHLLDRLHIVPADLLDQHSLTAVVRDAKPHEVYNLAAQSFVPTSWTQPLLPREVPAPGGTPLPQARPLPPPRARELRLGNLDAGRDWGYAGDYVDAMWRMLQRPVPADYVVGTGQTHTVRELCEVAFAHVGLDWKQHVAVDPRFVRPAEVDILQADASKARGELGWAPRTSFADLVRLMVDADLERLG